MPVSKIQPEYLKRGDEVAIISPSFCIDKDKLRNAVEFLAKWGLKARTGKNASKRSGPFAGTDDERLQDLQEATSNPSVKAVICSRGGYGLSRIIDRVDFTPLKKHPKWYVGFSDITVLHMWINRKYNIMSIHADMPLHYNDPEKSKNNFTTLKKALFGNYEGISWKGNFFRECKTGGEIIGGNLSLFSSLTGSPAEPDTRGKILFLEEVGEYFYHVDRMMNSLKLAGKLKDLSALIIGGMNKMEDTKIPWGKSVEETIMDIVGEYDYPVFFNFPAGHTSDNRAFYIGRKSQIETNGKKAVLTFR